ncbi:hypothetical protein GCM10010532_079550 [Dactylosporangium siamense]|uniref:Uncharacterized protein n=1 Tax=Dactylosporangium siamense TaxID=685454 RepID=A0A919UAW0_9ACTN|nr:hypothetical protein Dsi01nite_069500 [Dactylosporangium siamense]
MTPVPIDTPRGAPEVVAKLTLERADVERRFGLWFTGVDHDLSPAVMALGRLAGGTIIGFAKVELDPSPGVEVVQFAGPVPEPRDVVAELLEDTGLTWDEVTWLLPQRGEP